MAHPTPGPLRTLGTLLRAVAGLIALLALVAGTPYGLLALGHPPTELAGGADLLLQPDDGTVFLVVLTLAGWAAWATFTLSVAVEVVAVVRRRSAPRLKGLGGMQSLAGFLLGGIVLLAPTAASAATPAAAAAVTTTYTSAQHSPQATASPTPKSASPAASAPETDLPTHTVTSSTESPWDLAEEYLSDGQRWKDIAALNPDIPELAAGDSYLPTGKVIKLPADAHTPASADKDVHSTAPQATDSPSADHHSSHEHTQPDPVTVQPGDNLWHIAEEHGDCQDWHAIFELNKGERQPGGRHFTNPNLIFPGQQLDLPQAQTPPDTTDLKTEHEPSPDPEPTRQASPPQHDDPVHAPSSTPNTDPARRTQPGHTTAAPSTHTPEAGQQHTTDTAFAPAAAWTSGGFMAAALIGTLTTRRILQQRRRRPGRRIPMPTGTAAATEQRLRASQQPTGFDLLRRALRSLALHLAAAGRELPALEAVVLHEARVDLHLTSATDPCRPFLPGDHTHVWTCAATSAHLASEEELQQAETPYPALVSLGWDEDGALVLVDLEHVGILNLAGNPDTARHVLQAIAIELANNPLPGHLELTSLGATTPRLEDASPERVIRRADTADAVADLADHAADQRRTLAALGCHSLHAARLNDDAGDAWTPHVLLAQALPDKAVAATLFDTLNTQPRTASAVVTSASHTALPDQSWNLPCQPDQPVQLPGSGLTVRLQRLDDARYADAIELLTLAASPTDVAPDNWAETPDSHDADPTELPEEYAALEETPEKLGAPDDAQAAAGAETATVPLDKQQTAPTPTTTEQPSSGPSLADVLGEPARPHAEPASSPAAQEPSSAPRATSPEPTTGGPSILVLGPVTVEGATGRVQSNRITVGTELATFLALRPGADHHAIDDALWPGGRVTKDMRNAVISRLRSWLGKTPEGAYHFPRIQDTSDKRYRLNDTVTCDWTTFQAHARTGLKDHTEDGDLALRRALALVRGRPFAAVDPQRYAWAEPAMQEMVSAIVDVSHELSTRRREAGDVPEALWAARQGLAAAEESELLHRAVFLAHHQAGDIAALREAAAHLRKINDQLGCLDMQRETAELLRTLLPRPTVRTR